MVNAVLPQALDNTNKKKVSMIRPIRLYNKINNNRHTKYIKILYCLVYFIFINYTVGI